MKEFSEKLRDEIMKEFWEALLKEFLAETHEGISGGTSERISRKITDGIFGESAEVIAV